MGIAEPVLRCAFRTSSSQTAQDVYSGHAMAGMGRCQAFLPYRAELVCYCRGDTILKPHVFLSCPDCERAFMTCSGRF